MQCTFLIIYLIYLFYHLHFLLIHQVYLQAVRPDALFICVNPNDTMDRIKQCIKTAEGLSGGKVIGIVLYPQILEKRWQGDMHNYCSLSLEALNEFKQTYNKKLNLPIFVLGSKDDMDRAYNCAIDYFSC